MSATVRKVLVVGLDGLEPSLVEPWLAAGLMPNLAALRDCGGLARIATTAPAQTPVAWSTFATGTNPGGHGIFDFLRRDPATYRLELALNSYERKNVFTMPRAVNRRRGTPFWSLLAEAGITSTVLRCPCTYPPDPSDGWLLSGMGVPDLRGGLGSSTFFTTAEGEPPGDPERMAPLRRQENGSIVGSLIGPRRPRDGSDITVDFTLQPDPEGGRAVLLCGAAAPNRLVLPLRRWSEWMRVRFKVGLLPALRGIVRFRLSRLEPELELYASPINFDPAAPLFPLSSPGEFAGELAERIGLYHTTGMVEDHEGLSHGRLDEVAFLEQCDQLWNERQAMMVHELERLDEGLFFCLYDTSDRVQHMFWRYRDPTHPANRGRLEATEFAGVIEEHYRRADAAVGAALEFADERTLVIVLSDHGFGSFRRGVDLHAWLRDQGLLAIRAEVPDRPDVSSGLGNVDWSRTVAYAVGLGGIALNLRGREAQGIVAPDEAERWKAAIAEKLTGLVDPENQAVAIRSVRTREELYHGPYVAEAPDLQVQFGEGYRISWETARGGISANLFNDNTNMWSGDHIIDPELVPGVLLMNRPFDGRDARLTDLAPTILAALGVPQGPAMEGRSLR